MGAFLLTLSIGFVAASITRKVYVGILFVIFTIGVDVGLRNTFIRTEAHNRFIETFGIADEIENLKVPHNFRSIYILEPLLASKCEECFIFQESMFENVERIFVETNEKSANYFELLKECPANLKCREVAGLDFVLVKLSSDDPAHQKPDRRSSEECETDQILFYTMYLCMVDIIEDNQPILTQYSMSLDWPATDFLSPNFGSKPYQYSISSISINWVRGVAFETNANGKFIYSAGDTT